MKVVVCNKFGCPTENLKIEQRDEPIPDEGQVVVDVKAAAVTYVDALLAQDKYQFSMPLPYIPGGEIAGVVRAIGKGVTSVAVGDRVMAASPGGGFVEQALVSAADCQKVPQGADFGAALGLLYAYGTAYYALEFRAQLKKGETLLVLGAAGSVGLAAIEMAKLMGARVIAAASSADKLALCREYGADDTIDYSHEDLKLRTKELSDGKGVDVVYDIVGGDYAEQALRAIGWNGRFLVIGFTAGIPKLPLNLTLLKGCQVVGVFFGNLINKEPDRMNHVIQKVNQMMADGQLHPKISKRYSLAEAGQALDDFTERRIAGKVVIEP